MTEHPEWTEEADLWEQFPHDRMGLEDEITTSMEQMHPHELFSLLGDGGMVGEVAKREAKARGLEFEVTVEHGESFTATRVKAINDVALEAMNAR